MPRFPAQIVVSVPSGTPPLSVSSQTMVPNLNANYLQGYGPSDFAAVSHTHAISAVTGLQAALDAKLATAGGTISGTLALTGIGSDVSSVASWRILVRDPSTNQVRPMTAAFLKGYLDVANASHTHAISDVTGLQTALDGKITSTRQVATQHSLTGGGSLALDRTLSLVNDSASPGSSKYYGTDSGGTKGYHTLPSASGGNVRATTKVSTSYTATTSDSIIIAGESASSYTIILPTSGVTNGQMFTVVRPGSGGAGYPSVEAYPVTEDLSAPGDSRTWVWYSSDAQYYLINTIAAS